MMTTKQLNVSGPRNFKEKIELLKQKEAACTANFTAAIRDARKIQQIAGSCELNTLKTGGSLRPSDYPSRILYPDRNANPNLLRLFADPHDKPGCSDCTSELTSTTRPSTAAATTTTTTTTSNIFVRNPAIPLFTSASLTDLVTVSSDTRLPSAQPHHSRHATPGSAELNPSVYTTHTGLLRPVGAPGETAGILPRHPYAKSLHSLPDCTNGGHGASRCGPPNNNNHIFFPSNPGAPFATNHVPSYGLPGGLDQHRSHTDLQLRTSPVEPRKFDTRSVSAQLSPYRTVGHGGGNTVHAPLPPYTTVRPVPQAAVSLHTVPASSYHPSPPTRRPGAYLDPHSPRCDLGGSFSVQRTHPQPVEFTGAHVPAPLAFHTSQSVGSTTIAVDHRRVSSDSSIHQSALIVSQPVTPALDLEHLPATYATASYPLHTREVHSDPPPPPPPLPLPPPSAAAAFRLGPSSLGNVAGLKTRYPCDVDVDAHVIPAKRPYTSGMLSGGEGTVPKTQYADLLLLQTTGATPVTPSVGFDSPLPADPFLTPQQPASHRPSDHPGLPHRLSNVFSLSAPNINIQPRSNYANPLDASATDHVGESLAVTSSLGGRQEEEEEQSFSPVNTTSGDLCPVSDSADLDRYLQLPGAFLDHEDPSGWAGRRDSCTMTAEVLSALSTAVSDDCSTFADNREVRPSAYPPPPPLTSSPPPGPGYTAPPTTGTFSSLLCGDASEPVDDFTTTTTAAATTTTTVPGSPRRFIPAESSAPAGSTTASCVKVVANQLGISINPNDYQLLTNPHLSNYVTDETTEAQLLQ